MRHAVALLVVLVGCSGPGSGSSIEINPGPVAVVQQGNMLQLAAHVPDAALTFELVIDDAVAQLFDVHELVNTDAGAILTLVPSCSALGEATSGSVAMSVRADDGDIAPATLSIQIVADPNGVCAGAPEHAITHATLQLVDIAEGGRVLCTRVTATQHSAHFVDRKVLRISASASNHLEADDGHMLCEASAVAMDVWPPIDAPDVELVGVDTFSCDVAGCDKHASACCESDPARLVPLTSTELHVPVHSVSEYVGDDVDGASMGCADLDSNGTPEVIFAGQTMRLRSEVGHDGRFVERMATMHAERLLAFDWQATATTIQPVILGGFGSVIKRAQLVADDVTWVDDPLMTFATSDINTDPARPANVLPVRTTRLGGTRYVARLANAATVELTCVSPTCSGNVSIGIATANWDAVTLAVGDINGDNSQDIVVAYKPGTSSFGGAQSYLFRRFEMTWSATPTPTWTEVAPLTVDLPSFITRVVSVPSEGPCDRFYVLAGSSAVYELNPTQCSNAQYAPHFVPTPNEIYSVDTVGGRVLLSSALGIFELTHETSTATLIRQVDPVLQEQLATEGNALIDPSASNYGQTFVACHAAKDPSIAFQIKRGVYEWTQIDNTVDGFTDP